MNNNKEWQGDCDFQACNGFGGSIIRQGSRLTLIDSVFPFADRIDIVPIHKDVHVIHVQLKKKGTIFGKNCGIVSSIEQFEKVKEWMING